MRVDISSRLLAALLCAGSATAALAAPEPAKVNANNFERAETDLYFAAKVKQGAFGKLWHERQPIALDKQSVVRMNRDTLYSSGVFDLDAGPVTVVLPDAGKRFMSLQVVNQDHYVPEVTYAPGPHTYSRDKIGTRYLYVIVRTLANAEDPADIREANRLQDAIRIEQAKPGRYEPTQWDQATQDRTRQALKALNALGTEGARFGTREEVDPKAHLINTATGWGGNPEYAAKYVSVFPARNDGKTVYRLTVKDVPVDGFWSISVYNADGYFEKTASGGLSLNNLTARRDADGAISVQFGGCKADTANCLGVMPGWNYVVRMYRPRAQILDGRWTFPAAQALN